MKAIVIEEFGGPDVLKLQDVKIGKPGKGQVIVRLAAIGVNYVDVYYRTGIYSQKPPFTPGLEGAGTVEELGDGVTSVKVGDRVTFVHQPKTYAEKCIVDVDSLISLPDDLSFEEGAAFPLQGMTAHYLIHEFRKPKSGDVVLIHAAAGGMGLLLVQWAKHLGARVIGTVSTEEKAKMARKAGADEVILYSKQDFVKETLRLTDGHGADLIIDGVGKTTFAGNLEAATIRGMIVIFGRASGPADPISPNVLMPRSLTIGGGSLSNFIADRKELLMRANDVMKGIKEGWLKLQIGKTLPLSEAKQAHTLLEGRQTTGKILLIP